MSFLHPMKLLLALLVLSVCWRNSSALAETRIALVTLEPEARSAADLLAAALTGKDGLALVERDEVDRVFREQALIAGQRTEFSRLGQVLRAQGLVLLQTIRSPGLTNLAVRLVATQSGVLLDAALYPLPLREPGQWAGLAAGRLMPLLGKLEVPRDRAVPVSLLNLRAAVGTAASAQTERALSALLFHRLAAEREIFVLERRQMGRLEWEKELAGSDDRAFWNGSFLLEGLIDRDGTAADTVTIHTRLVPPGNGPVVSIEASGPRRDLPLVTEHLTARILTAMKREGAVKAWNPAAEAERFEQEATWALRWRMWPEAFAAAESAAALGRRTEPVVAMMVRALIEQTRTTEAFQFDAIARRGWATDAPASKVLAHAVDALQTFLAHCQTAAPERWRTNGPWLEHGLDAVQAGALVLRHYYWHGWRTDRWPEDLAVLREALRDVVAVLPVKAARKEPPRWQARPPGVLYSREQALVLHGPFWQETPQDALRLWRELMDSGAFERRRTEVLLRAWQDPLWIGWTRADRESGAAAWESFIGGLAKATNTAARAEGLLFRLAAARFDQPLAEALEAFLDTVMTADRQRFVTDLDFSILDAFDRVWERQMAAVATLRRARLAETLKSFEFARMKHYLQTAKVHDIDRAGPRYTGYPYSPAQAKELLPVVEDYAKRFPGGDWIQSIREAVKKAAERPVDEFAEFFNAADFNRERFQQLFVNRVFTRAEAQHIAGLVWEHAVRRGWNDELRDLNQRVRAVFERKPEAGVGTPGAVLRITQAWPAGVEAEDGRFQGSQFQDLRERDGRLYASVVRQAVSYDRQYIQTIAVVQLDPPANQRSILLSRVQWTETHPFRFEVFDGQVYALHGRDMIRRHDLRAGQHRDYKVDLPLTNNVTFAVAGRRLLLVSPEFLAELMPVDCSVKLLASTRRRPATTKLDSVDWPHPPQVSIHPDGSLLALFAPPGQFQMWKLRPGATDWESLPAGNGFTGTLDRLNQWPLSFAGSFLGCHAQTYTPGGQVVTLLSDNRAQLARWAMPLNYPLTPGMSGGSLMQQAFDGTNLWMLLPALEYENTAAGFRQAKPLSDRNFTLLRFDPRWEIPATIPLKIEADAPAGMRPLNVPGGNIVTTRLRFTSQGLLLLAFQTLMPGDSMPGFWFLPYADIEAWVKTHHPETRNLPRCEPELRRQFDRNGNGKLDVEEVQAARADQAWRAADREHQAQRLLKTFDFDHDGRLNATEVTALVRTASLGVTAADRNSPQRSPVVPFLRDPPSFLARFDRDKSGGLDATELMAIAPEIAPLPGGAPSGFQPGTGGPVFGPGANLPRPGQPSGQPVAGSSRATLDRYDTNKNGRLDPDELRVMMEERRKGIVPGGVAPKPLNPATPQPTKP